jgi:uncharacterized protein YutE (UPF0331/DUF86 family)
LTGYLRDQKILDAEEISLFNELRDIRNRAVHVPTFEVSTEEAKDYLILAELILGALRRNLPSY